MNRVLILAPAPEVILTVSRALPEEAAVEGADQIQKAIKIHNQNPFSLIFIDLQLLKATGAKYDFTQLALLYKKPTPYRNLWCYRRNPPFGMLSKWSGTEPTIT